MCVCVCVCVCVVCLFLFCVRVSIEHSFLVLSSIIIIIIIERRCLLDLDAHFADRTQPLGQGGALSVLWAARELFLEVFYFLMLSLDLLFQSKVVLEGGGKGEGGG